MLKTKLNELYNKIHFEETDNKEDLIEEFNINYDELSKKHIEEKYFFIGAPLNIFTGYFNNQLTTKGKEIIDFSEAEYIKGLYSKTFKLFNYNNPYPQIPSEQPVKMTNHALLDLLNTSNKLTIKRIIKRRLEFLETELYKRGYTIETEYQEFIREYKLFFKEDPIKKNEYLLQKKNNTENEILINPLNTNITPTELIEIVKALIENGNIKGKQKDIITEFSNFFNVKIKNPDKIIQDIKKRSIGSETLFLDRLKASLYNFIIK